LYNLQRQGLRLGHQGSLFGFIGLFQRLVKPLVYAFRVVDANCSDKVEVLL
jgi:hypothetical protein